MGLRMLEKDIASEILRIEKQNQWKVLPGPADTTIYEVRNGMALADDYTRAGIRFVPAIKSPGTRVTRWQKVRQRLNASLQFPMEEAGMFVFDSCHQFIRTVPVLHRSESNLDDIDTDLEDHIADETGYMCLFKPRFLLWKKDFVD